MATVELLDSDLYQNGRVFVLDDGREVLLRERYASDASLDDAVIPIANGQDLRLLAFNRYGGNVARPENYWWLIADRNGVFNPIFNGAVDDDGIEFDVTERPVLVPNVLKQKPLL